MIKQVSYPCEGRSTCYGCNACAKPSNFHVLSIEGNLLSDKILVDIGTTTVAVCAIVNGEKKAIGFVNPQRRYGADVMSRIKASNEGREEELRRCLREKLKVVLEEHFDKLCEEKKALVIAANTTMMHIFRGLSTEGLGKAPFHPVDLSFYKEMDSYFGREIIYLPGISTFVGADIVSGILATDMDQKDEVALLVDLGTNGEMVIGNKKKLLVASTAAGPAFEGSRLAMTLHGSGIISLLSRLRQNDVMDEYGTLSDEYFEDGYPVLKGTMSQEEIRDIQMAKSAIRSGIEILIQEYGIKKDELKTVYLAGGMSPYLKVEDGVAIGLFPEEFKEITKVVGNSALKGADVFASTEEAFAKERVEAILSKADEVVLANHKNFEEYYIEYMNF